MSGDARSDLLERIRGLAAYKHPEAGRPAEFAPKYGGSGNVYYDDNLWIALGLVAANQVMHDPSLLRPAEQVFDLVGDGWDADATHPCPGGVFWTRLGSNHDRNTVTTANSVLLAMYLYERTGSADVSQLRADGLRLDEALPRPLGRSRARPPRPEGRRRLAHVELQPGRDDRRRRAPVPRDRRAPLPRGRDAHGQRGRSASLHDPLASGEPPFFLAIFYRDLLELPGSRSVRPPQRLRRRGVGEGAGPEDRALPLRRPQPTLLDQAAMVQIYASWRASSGRSAKRSRRRTARSRRGGACRCAIRSCATRWTSSAVTASIFASSSSGSSALALEHLAVEPVHDQPLRGLGAEDEAALDERARLLELVGGTVSSAIRSNCSTITLIASSMRLMSTPACASSEPASV